VQREQGGGGGGRPYCGQHAGGIDSPRGELPSCPIHPAQGRGLARTDHATYCPYKGDCAYYSIPLGGVRSTNAVWTYESPYAAVAAIKDYLAFYPDRVDAIEEKPGG
jgi:hypothetical protein